MAIVQAAVFFRENRTYTLGNITFDINLGEDHVFANSVTSYNVEDGSNITDHIRNQPEEGSVTMLISNFSINTSGITSNRAQDAYDELVRIWRERQLVDIATIYGNIENIAITNITIPRDEGTGEAITCSISFRKVNVVQLQQVFLFASINIPGPSLDDSDPEATQNRQSAPRTQTGRNIPVFRDR